MSEIKLLPCPFCGGKPEIERKGDRRQSTIYACAECSCRLETGEEWNIGTDWNRRSTLSSATVAEREPVGTLTTGDLKLLKAGNSVVANPMAVAPHRDQVNLYLDPPPTSELEAENARLRESVAELGVQRDVALEYQCPAHQHCTKEGRIKAAEASLSEALKGERNETISAVFQTVGECLAGMTHDQVSEIARRKIKPPFTPPAVYAKEGR